MGVFHNGERIEPQFFIHFKMKKNGKKYGKNEKTTTFLELKFALSALPNVGRGDPSQKEEEMIPPQIDLLVFP